MQPILRRTDTIRMHIRLSDGETIDVIEALARQAAGPG
jgi:hypothetical protein